MECEESRQARIGVWVDEAMELSNRIRGLLATASPDAPAQALEHLPDAVYELDQFIWWLTEGSDDESSGDQSDVELALRAIRSIADNVTLIR